MADTVEKRFVATSTTPSHWMVMDTGDLESIAFVNERPMFYRNDAEHLAKRLNEIAARSADTLPRLLEIIRAGTALGTGPAMYVRI